MITRSMRWPAVRLGLMLVAGAGLLFSAVLMSPAVAADDVSRSQASVFSTLYVEPIEATAGVMLATQGLVGAAVVATRDAQGNVTIECRDQLHAQQMAAQGASK